MNKPNSQIFAVINAYASAAKWRWYEYLFWFCPVLAYFAFPDNHLLLSQIVITGLFALSLDLILGYAGIISLGHAAFFGVGAYTVGLLGINGMSEPILGLVCAALASACLGFISSFLLLRGNDLSRLMVTLGVALMLYEFANKFSDITGGVDGIAGIEIDPILGVFEFGMLGSTGYVYALIVLFILFYFARKISLSPFGQSLKGIRMNSKRMPALGVPMNKRLIKVYTIAAAYAGVAGALLAQTNQFVSIDVLAFHRSAELLLILILGGAGFLYGGLVGAVIYVVANYLLADMNPQYWQFWLGLILVLVVLFARGGILGLLQKMSIRLKSSRAVKGLSS